MNKIINHTNLIQKKLILEFWSLFGGWSVDKKYNNFDSLMKLNELKRMADIVLNYKNQTTVFHRREKFNKCKAKLCRQKIGSDCFVCGCKGFNRHHIIQLQNGGINSEKNLIILCDICHAEIHHWLKEPANFFLY